jgi:hypothetical protein
MPKSVEGISCEKMTKASTPDSKPLLADESQLQWRLRDRGTTDLRQGLRWAWRARWWRVAWLSQGWGARGADEWGVWGLYEACSLGLCVIGDGADKRMLGLGVVWALGFRSWVTVSVLRGKGRALAQLCSTVHIMCFRDGQVYSRVYTFFCGACLPLVRCTVQARVTGLCPLVPALP